MRWWVMLLASLTACSFDASALSGSAAGDPDDPQTPIATARCGTPGVLIDDFETAGAADFWYVFGSATESDGALQMDPPVNTVNGTGLYLSRSSVDLRGARAMIEVAEMVDTGTVAQAFFGLIVDLNNSVTFIQSGGALQLTVRNAGAVSSTTVNYDPSAQRFWQFREQGGTLFFEVSADGASFSTLSQTLAPPFLSTVAIGIGALTPAAVVAPGRFRVAQLNTLVERATWCKVTSLSDDFEDGTISPAWGHRRAVGTGCTPVESGGSARFNQNGAANSNCYYASSAAYDLVESSALLRVDTISSFEASWTTYLQLRDPADRTVELAFVSNQMCAAARDSGGSTLGGFAACVPYTAANIFWRIRESGGVLFCETSPDRVGWAVVKSGPSPFALDGVEVAFGTRTTDALTGAINLAVQLYNTP